MLRSNKHTLRAKMCVCLLLQYLSLNYKAVVCKLFAWDYPRPLPCVAPPRQRVASSPHLAINIPFALTPTRSIGTSATSTTHTHDGV